MTSNFKYLTVILLLSALLAGCASTAQIQSSASDPSSSASKVDEQKKNTIAYEGLFSVYQDTTDGSTKFEIKKDQLDKEYIYFGHTADGVTDAGSFRGAYQDDKIFKIKRYFDKIEFVVQNTRYQFDDDSALSNAEMANISNATLISEKILAENDSTIIISGDPIFLSENMNQVKPSPSPNSRPGGFSLGGLSSSKTKYSEIRGYPENIDVVVEYVYENPSPMNGGSAAVTDARAVSIKHQHSFIAMPENDFQPRFDDPRIGFFMTEKDDQVSTSVTPYLDVIHRWHLEKKNPNAEMSEPVEPITWWIENTTPHAFRETIKEATLAWNEAFEAAGFRNAVEVKVQPDDAEWDAGDIRYNVLRWTSSPNPPFGGYGPSFVNPRTGQILGSDIMLEWVFFSNRYRQENIYTETAFSSDLIDDAMNPEYCSFGHHLQQNNMFGMSALQVMGYPDEDLEGFQHEAMTMLILHELGHTFGLNHNMQASTLHSPEEIHNKQLTSTVGLTGSVMDYSSVNVASDRSRQGHYYDTKPGPYDVWAIEFGYSPALDDPEAEKERLNAIAARSTDSELAFGNDADDMRSPGKAIDPRVMVGDMSADPIAYGIDRIHMAENLMDGLIEKFSVEGQSYQPMRDAYMALMAARRTQTGVISRYVGGVYKDRAFVGQEGGRMPFTPVEVEKQREAMNSLSEHLFAPDAFDMSHEVYNYLQIQRRGFNFFSSSEDPKIHDQVLAMQSSVLAHLLHPSTMKRITDSRTYGNTYNVAEVVGDLTSAIFDADAAGNVNTFRQNLQIQYIEGLIAVIGSDSHDRIAKSAALYNLQNIRGMMESKRNANTESRAHAAHVILAIDKALDA
ncbi:zinc-dependent metalloprotease [Rhodohalobacter sp. 8-1]|uniref:zinc-dependent metalloprotease n=1 Tax=Rhodohalobacter sp. 8-1 TaxID=3131972 RepID=UPI0030EF2BA7